MSRKPNWKQRGITRKAAIHRQRQSDYAHVLLSRKGSLPRSLYDAIVNSTPPPP